MKMESFLGRSDNCILCGKSFATTSATRKICPSCEHTGRGEVGITMEILYRRLVAVEERVYRLENPEEFDDRSILEECE